MTTPSDNWLNAFVKFEEYFEALHKRSWGWQINNEIRLITPLQDYLRSLYPAIPEKAIKLYLIIRTKIRVQAINNKIAKIQRDRKARQFQASSVDLEPEGTEEEVVVGIEEAENEQNQNANNFEIDEIYAAVDVSEMSLNVDEEDEELLDV